MKIIVFFAISLIYGCTSWNGKDPDPRRYIKIGIVEFKDNLSTLQLVNLHNKEFRYQHWFGQSGSPVAYCEYETGEESVCSDKVFMLEDSYFTHDTVLWPNESITFTAHLKGAKRVGVLFWYDNGEEIEDVKVWCDLE